MSDDIVTRLRIACRQEGAEYCGECQPCQAADEIERLRTERLHAADEIEGLESDRDRWRSLANALIRDLAFRTDEQAANFIVQQMVARIERERAVRGE